VTRSIAGAKSQWHCLCERWVNASRWRPVEPGSIIADMPNLYRLYLRRTGSLLHWAAAWAVMIALLINVATALPLMLQMVAGDSVMVMAAGVLCPFDMGGGSSGKHPGQTAPPIDHEHCLICQGGIGTAILASPFPVAAALSIVTIVAVEPQTVFALQAFPTAYISRAPPLAI
jgi:hypothetical protein